LDPCELPESGIEEFPRKAVPWAARKTRKIILIAKTSSFDNPIVSKQKDMQLKTRDKSYETLPESTFILRFRGKE